jgi:N-methylhydantoinase A
MGGRVRIGIDTGGTFTDVVAFDEDSGALVATKTPSTPDDPSRAFVEGARKINPGPVGGFVHGTTVATNALLEGDFRGLGFLVTQGFRHVLEIARQSVPDGYGNSYFWVKPDRIVPLHLVREVPERLDHTGAVVRSLDEDAVAEAARDLVARGVTAIGVCLLHSYANPEHERRVRAILAREVPGCAVSISADVLREYREYERSMTTLVDAFVKPRVARYVAAIGDRLAAFDHPPFAVMKSNGGIASAEQITAQPITTVLSGPAAGALGASVVATAAGFDRVLALDGGGTSTDVSVVTAGEPRLTTEGVVGRFPLKVPMIDIVTVGTGGGSVAWVSREGGLKVGPRSAGADPGPLCYGRGGTEPTVTDAHLLLGRIPPHLLGGEIPLDVEAACAGLAKLAGDIGMEVEACASGVLEIAAWNQANAIRQVTVRRGLDVRDFVLTAFGGSGPLQACRLVDLLGLRAALVPRDPGTVSAFGLLTVDVRVDDVQTHIVAHDDLDLGELAAAYAGLEERARATLAREGFAPADQRVLRAADLRYAGQAFEVPVPAPDGPVDASFAAATLAAFHAAHRRRYGYAYAQDPSKQVEWVNLRVTGTGPVPTPTLPRLPAGTGDPQPTRTRPVRFAEWIETPLFDRARLGAGDSVAGPAVLEEFGSTVPVPPGFTARVDPFGNLILERA